MLLLPAYAYMPLYAESHTVNLPVILQLPFQKQGFPALFQVVDADLASMLCSRSTLLQVVISPHARNDCACCTAASLILAWQSHSCPVMSTCRNLPMGSLDLRPACLQVIIYGIDSLLIAEKDLPFDQQFFAILSNELLPGGAKVPAALVIDAVAAGDIAQVASVFDEALAAGEAQQLIAILEEVRPLFPRAMLPQARAVQVQVILAFVKVAAEHISQ